VCALSVADDCAKLMTGVIATAIVAVSKNILMSAS
jgi:hypothetical protein